MKTGDVLVSGHTHIPAYVCDKGCVFLNPGSVSKPRGGMPKSFMVYDSEGFIILDFDGNVIFRTT